MAVSDLRNKMREEIEGEIRSEAVEAENRRREEIEDQKNKMRAKIEEEIRREIEETENRKRKKLRTRGTR